MNEVVVRWNTGYHHDRYDDDGGAVVAMTEKIQHDMTNSFHYSVQWHHYTE